MISILKTQLFRLKKSKLFWALFIVNGALPILSLILLIGLAAFVSIAFGGSLDANTLSALNMTPYDPLSSLATFSSDSSLFAIICCAVVLSKEFSNGTMRNVLLANKSRSQMYWAYLLTALIISAAYFLVAFVMYLLLFGSVFGFKDPSGGAAVTTILCHFAMGLSSVLVVATCVCCMLFASKKTSGTIIFPLLLCLLMPGLVSSIETMIIQALAITGTTISDSAMQFLPFANWNALDSAYPSGVCTGMIILYNVVLSAIYFLSSYFPFKKADLK